MTVTPRIQMALCPQRGWCPQWGTGRG